MNEEFRIETLGKGAVVEAVNRALSQVLLNIVDPNTPAKAKRSVKEELLQAIGCVRRESSVTALDDGVTQAVEMASGISLAKKAKLPNPVTLRPFSTFIELEQPERQFVFRMRNGDPLTVSLHEADGGAWRNNTMQDIKDWLEKAFEENGIDVQIIA